MAVKILRLKSKEMEEVLPQRCHHADFFDGGGGGLC